MYQKRELYAAWLRGCSKNSAETNLNELKNSQCGNELFDQALEDGLFGIVIKVLLFVEFWEECDNRCDRRSGLS